MKDLKALIHLTIQVAVSTYGDQILERDVRDILARTGKRLGQALQIEVENALAVELHGEPDKDWTVSNTFVGASEHFASVQHSLIQQGRCDGLKYAINYLTWHQESALKEPDLPYIIRMLSDELQKEEQRD